MRCDPLMIGWIWWLYKIDHLSHFQAIEQIEKHYGFPNARQTVEQWSKHWR